MIQAILTIAKHAAFGRREPYGLLAIGIARYQRMRKESASDVFDGNHQLRCRILAAGVNAENAHVVDGKPQPLVRPGRRRIDGAPMRQVKLACHTCVHIV